MKKSIIKATAAVLAASAALASGAHASAVQVQPPMYNPNGPVAPQPALVRPVNYTTVVVRTNVPFNAPARLGGFTRSSSGLINPNVAQGIYRSGNRQIILRKARGDTGMRASYPGVYHTTIAGTRVVLRGTEKGYFTAEWSRNGFNYSLSTNVPFVLSQMNTVVSGAVNV